MMKEKPIEVNVAIYRLHVIVFMECTIDDIVKWGLKRGIEQGQFTDQWIQYRREITQTAQGFCSYYGDNGNHDILIWLRDRPLQAKDYGTLWHELIHAVDYIAKSIDPQEFLYDSNMCSEPRAFLYEYLAVEITRDLWNRPVPKAKKRRR